MDLGGSGTGIAHVVAGGSKLLSADTDLDQTMPLVWLMLVISIIGAAITWAFLAYALWKYRDPATKGRRYG